MHFVIQEIFPGAEYRGRGQLLNDCGSKVYPVTGGPLLSVPFQVVSRVSRLLIPSHPVWILKLMVKVESQMIYTWELQPSYQHSMAEAPEVSRIDPGWIVRGQCPQIRTCELR